MIFNIHNNEKCTQDLGSVTSFVDKLDSEKVVFLQCPEMSKHRKIILLPEQGRMFN